VKSKENIKKVALEEQLHGGGSAFLRYRVKAVGEVSWGGFVLYEAFALLLADLGGALGYVLRKMVARRLFRAAGSGLILGRGLVLRHPGKISIGHRVAIDDHCFIDGSGSGEIGVVLGDGVILSRNCIVLGKNGYVVLQDRVDVGCNCVFASASGITVGAATIIAGNCYIGGGRYFHDDLQVPIMDQGRLFTRRDRNRRRLLARRRGHRSRWGAARQGSHCRCRRGGDQGCPRLRGVGRLAGADFANARRTGELRCGAVAWLV
jgi:hypothetical protein